MIVPDSTHKPLATYEDLGYRDVFWAARTYEDACDRIALRALLPSGGARLIDVGAGFGRLADEYAGYESVVLLDSSEVHVAAAGETLGGDPRFEIHLGDALALPFPDAAFDVAVCVRVFTTSTIRGRSSRSWGGSCGPAVSWSSSTPTSAISNRLRGGC